MISVASTVGLMASLFLHSLVTAQDRSATPPSVRAANALYWSGEYEACIEMCAAEVERGVWNERWSWQLIECQFTTGAYEEAIEVYENVVQRYASSLRLRLLGERAYLFLGRDREARETRQIVHDLLDRLPAQFSQRENLIPLGEFFLGEGEDPKKVLEICFDQAIREDPTMVEAHVATAELALEKHDAAVAAQSARKVIELEPENPLGHYLLAASLNESNREQSAESVQRALQLNPRHVASLLQLTRNAIDSQNFEIANSLLSDLESINPRHADLWSLRAALAHLNGDFKSEGKFRSKALADRPLNPRVDFLIGRTLANQYRFSESATYQRRALKMQADYIPALQQLAQDLLRLGELEEGWRLANKVRDLDPFDVSIYNLSLLEKRLETFTSIRFPGFVVRMQADEAVIYGDEVRTLLTQARDLLTEKYDATLVEPVYVEIFPEQGDFAIRTFGLPGGEGFLGVCFGRLITANSPSALRQTPTNWKSVLWHEYCHVVTLQKTQNRIPRWLSEGLSVHEELQRDPRWGQILTPEYRGMLLGSDFTPLSQMNRAFMQAKSPLHLQLAYLEAALAVEFLLEQKDARTLNLLLDDVASGINLNQSLGKNYDDIDQLDRKFRQFVTTKCEAFYPETNFQPLSEDEKGSDILRIADMEPQRYAAQIAAGMVSMQTKQYTEAIKYFKHAHSLFQEDRSPNSALRLLATAYQRNGDETLALNALEQQVSLCADDPASLLELGEHAFREQQWEPLARWSKALIAINPMQQRVQELRTLAAQNLNDTPTTISGIQAQLQMGVSDKAAMWLQLARALQRESKIPEAKRAVLKAIEEAPRYAEALRLFADLDALSQVAQPSDTTTNSQTEEPESENESIPTPSNATSESTPKPKAEAPGSAQSQATPSSPVDSNGNEC